MRISGHLPLLFGAQPARREQPFKTPLEKPALAAPRDSVTLFGLTPQREKKIYSFGTSGYRNNTEEGFNATVVRQIASAITDKLVLDMQRSGKKLPVLVGGDTRDKTRELMPVVVRLLQARGLDVLQADSDVPSPVLAYAAAHPEKVFGENVPETAGAILLTASHNPWSYGGFNFLTPDGAVAPAEVTEAFEKFQRHPLMRRMPGEGKVTTFDPYPAYREHIKNTFKIDFEAIKKANLQIFYDPLYATGRNYFSRLLKDEGIEVTSIHDTDVRPKGYDGMPEPTAQQMKDLRKKLHAAEKSGIKIGFANDGDSDRFGILDEHGSFVNPNDVLALVIYHLIKNRGESGSVVRNLATTHYLDALAETVAKQEGKDGVTTKETPVGYKYIADEIIDGQKPGNTPVLIGGESSGGLTVTGHIPEKDGILANLLVAELVAKEGKPLSEILKDIRALVPKKFANNELVVRTDNADAVMDYFKGLVEKSTQYAGMAIDGKRSKTAAEAMEETYGKRDGIKMYFRDGSWILLRKSGTEPVFRVFIETVGRTDREALRKRDRIYDKLEKQLNKQFGIPYTGIAVKN